MPTILETEVAVKEEIQRFLQTLKSLIKLETNADIAVGNSCQKIVQLIKQLPPKEVKIHSIFIDDQKKCEEFFFYFLFKISNALHFKREEKCLSFQIIFSI